MTAADFDRYKRICATEMPYPLNYMTHGNDQQQMLAAMMGMMVEKGLLKRELIP